MFSDVCIVIPALNEEKSIGATLLDVFSAMPLAKVLVVDNGSTDRTAAMALEHGATVIPETRKGKGYAVTAGVLSALKNQAQWIAFHDADNEYSAKDLATLISRCKQKQELNAASLLMGVGLREVPLSSVHWRSLIANWLAKTALKSACGRDVPLDLLTGARVFNKAAAKKLVTNEGYKPLSGFELEMALNRRALLENVEIVQAPVKYTPRPLSEKKIKGADLYYILKAAWGY